MHVGPRHVNGWKRVSLGLFCKTGGMGSVFSCEPKWPGRNLPRLGGRSRMNIENELKNAIDALNAQAISYALCGGLAVVLHGYVRTTDDIDLLVLPEDIGRAKEALKAAGFRQTNPVAMHFPYKTFPVTIHRLIHFEGEDYLVMDLIEVGDAMRDVWEGREQYEWEGRAICVVSRAGLHRLKRNAGRPQDLADIANLRLEEDSDHGG